MTATAIPAPIGGWNARDALDKMDPKDAVRLVNWVPRAGYVESRKGYSLAVTDDGVVGPYTGLGGPVESLIAYKGSASEKLLAAANGKIWNVTTSTAASLGTGFASSRWQFTAFDDRSILTNGADTAQAYNGTSLANLVVTGAVATSLWGCNTFKGRVFYWYENAQSFWYAAAGSFQGLLTKFDLSMQLQTGGSLVMMVSWTLDSGDGIDDLAAFIFSTGEVLLYQGDDPGDAAAWGLIGRFQIGEPLGIRAHAKVGGTEIIITRDGYVDLAQALRDGRYSEASTYSNKIIRAAKESAQLYYQQYGWQAILYPAGQQFIVNVPVTTGQSIQHVRETSTGSWCQFDGLNAVTFAVHNERLWFGTSDGNVYEADIGTQDNGGPISMDAIPAFNALGSRATQKQVTAVNVVTNYASPGFLALDCLADFSTQRRSTVTPGPFDGTSEWNAADWDTSVWATPEGDDAPIRPAWRNVQGTGYTLTVSVRASTRAQNIIWYSTDILYRNAGAI